LRSDPAEPAPSSIAAGSHFIQDDEKEIGRASIAHNPADPAFRAPAVRFGDLLLAITSLLTTLLALAATVLLT